MQVYVFRSQSVRVGFDLIKVKTLTISQVVTYLVKAGLISKTLFRSVHTKGNFPNGLLHTDFIMLDRLNVQNWLNYDLPQSWSIQSKIPFPSQWLLEWHHFTTKLDRILIWELYISRFYLSMKLIGFQEHLLTMICFSAESLINGPTTCLSFSK